LIMMVDKTCFPDQSLAGFNMAGGNSLTSFL